MATREQTTRKLYIYDKLGHRVIERYGAIVGKVAFLMAKPDSARAEVVPAQRVYETAEACKATFHSTVKRWWLCWDYDKNGPQIKQVFMIKGSLHKPKGWRHEQVTIVSGSRLVHVSADSVFATQRQAKAACAKRWDEQIADAQDQVDYARSRLRRVKAERRKAER